MNEAIDIIGACITRNEQSRQLRFMADTQGREFAEQVKAKWLESKKGKAK